MSYNENSDSIDALVNASHSEQSWVSRDDALPRLTALAEDIKSPKRKKVFELRYLQHKTCKEISRQLGMKVDAIQVNLYRAKKELIKLYHPKSG